MKFARNIDANCSSCHGKGEIVECVERHDGTWINSFQCHCVTYHHDDEMKAFLAEVAVASAYRKDSE
jgi:hypothetical protein